MCVRVLERKNVRESECVCVRERERDEFFLQSVKSINRSSSTSSTTTFFSQHHHRSQFSGLRTKQRFRKQGRQKQRICPVFNKRMKMKKVAILKKKVWSIRKKLSFIFFRFKKCEIKKVVCHVRANERKRRVPFERSKNTFFCHPLNFHYFWLQRVGWLTNDKTTGNPKPMSSIDGGSKRIS